MKLEINKPLITGVVLGAAAGLAKMVTNSSIGYEAFDTMRSGSWEKGIDGWSEAGMVAGATVTTYGLTKMLVKKCIPIASERTSTATSLTSAAALAYEIGTKTQFLEHATQKIGLYDSQIAAGLETLVSHGIVAGIVFAGGSLVYDLCGLAKAKLSKEK